MSEFWRRKIRTYFATIDVKRNGFLSKKDFEDMADALSDAENGSPELRALIKNNSVALWRKFMKSANSDDDGLLTADILVASLDQQRNDQKFKNTYLKVLHDYFRVADVNGDGSLSEDEFARLYTGVGFKDTSFIHTAFGYMDLDEDGKVSLYEYTYAKLQYITTEDDRLLYGPLVD